MRGAPSALLATLMTLPAALMTGCFEEAPIEGTRCNAEHLCPAGYACQAGRCRKLQGKPVSGCTSDDQCHIGVCWKEVGYCVQCRQDMDCAAGVCLPAENVCGCAQASHCRTWRCAKPEGASYGFCNSCYADAQCESGVCNRDTGACEPPEDAIESLTVDQRDPRDPRDPEADALPETEPRSAPDSHEAR